MNKIIPILIVGIFVISGLGAVAVTDSETKSLIKMESIPISEIIIEDKTDFIEVDFDESTSKLMETGNPIIPVITRVYTFPAGTKINMINVDFDTDQYILEKKIQPASRQNTRMQLPLW